MKVYNVSSIILSLTSARRELTWLLPDLETREERNEIFEMFMQLTETIETIKPYKAYDDENED